MGDSWTYDSMMLRGRSEIGLRICNPKGPRGLKCLHGMVSISGIDSMVW